MFILLPKVGHRKIPLGKTILVEAGRLLNYVDTTEEPNQITLSCVLAVSRVT